MIITINLAFAFVAVLATLEYLIGLKHIALFVKNNSISRLREDLHDFVDCSNQMNEEGEYDPMYGSTWNDVGKVFPSDEVTVFVQDDKEYGGAHSYRVKHSFGFNNGKADYVPFFTDINFVQKLENGKVIDGVQSEQLLLIVLDRTQKLHTRFPDDNNLAIIAGCNMAIDASATRVKARIERGVMGELKK